MKQYGLELQEAFDWIGELHQDLENCFLETFRNLPSFPLESDIVNRETHEYAHALGNWVRANDQWSFEVRALFFVSSFFFFPSSIPYQNGLLINWIAPESALLR